MRTQTAPTTLRTTAVTHRTRRKPTPAARAPPDGIGDACQCGDVSGNGRVTTADATLITRSLLVPPTATLTSPALCNVGGNASCTTADAVIVTRAAGTADRNGRAGLRAGAAVS